MTLRSKLIRLAHANPELRAEILPLLKTSGRTLTSSLKVGPERVDTSATSGLRRMKKFPARNRGDLDSAVKSAAYYAQKLGEKMFVYAGTSYGSYAWRVSSKKSEYLNFINNSGEKMLSVTPDLEVSWMDIIRSRFDMGDSDSPIKGAAAKGIPVSSQAIRKSYYTASDGVGALVDAVKGEAATKQDAKLLKAVAKADKALGEVYHALRPYAWD
jgi:hypothetical protein